MKKLLLNAEHEISDENVFVNAKGASTKENSQSPDYSCRWTVHKCWKRTKAKRIARCAGS